MNGDAAIQRQIDISLYDTMAESKEDVLQLLYSLDQNDAPVKAANAKRPTGAAAKTDNDDDDIMGFLDSLTKRGANSGKSTPRLEKKAEEKSLKVEDKGETPSETNERSFEETTLQSPPEQLADPLSSISNWWSRNKGDIWNTATSAIKQAEAKVRELQPEVQHHKALESLGDRFSKIGLSKDLIQSTFSSMLETIAPPISRHEQLRIHVFHDMVGYPTIENIVYGVFDRVMQQVEGGGHLTMVVQKGKERHRRGSDVQVRDLNMFRGDVQQGTKLAAANVEDFMRSKASKSDHSDVSEKDKSDDVSFSSSQPLSSTNIRISDIYLSIQPASAYPETAKTGTVDAQTAPPIVAATSSQSFYFIIYLKDPANDIGFSTVSQAFPLQWAEWLDAPNRVFESFEADPRDWIIDWIEEGLGLAVGVVAQSYVTKRMGVDALAEAEQVANEAAVQS